MSKILIIRLTLLILFFFSIFFGDWYVTAMFGLIALTVSSAWEIIIGAVLIDLLYTTSFGFLGFQAVWTVCALAIYFAFHQLRSRLF